MSEEGSRWTRRAASVPPLSFPAELPVVAVKDELATAIRDHQVVVVAGETGSGKTTQLPKICLELGRGVRGMIGHTQPRRIAARAVAERLAYETGVRLGEQVGYQVRFTDHSRRDTLIKVMTDGILLSELQRDRRLRRYDTIIVDEAHERSLNIDFLLGYLRQLLPRRPDLKVVITSATIDPQRFADHFATPTAPVPVIEVSGRTYPVQIRYRPLTRVGPTGEVVDIDQISGVCEAVEELWTEGPGASGADGGGQDILVFLSGEREIRDTAEALRGLELPATQILPLYGRLSAAEQHRVFLAHPGRRVVLATNVAETSLTVPGIRYVVDAGTARISRFSQRTKVQRLPIEPISQASAQQRSGRCGRTADGVAIRLYSEEDFQARPQFTDPEVQRTNLASVILQMTALGLGEVARFPFIDPPDARAVTDGVRLLHELGAFAEAAPPDRQQPGPGADDGPQPDSASRTYRASRSAEGRRRRAEGPRLTGVGRSLARIPLDPRLARMLIQAGADGTLREVLVIVAALSIHDVRERPSDKQTQADQAHARFRDERSDFVTVLNLWDYLRAARRERSGSAFRRMCAAEYLHYLRIREWQDLRAQLAQVAKELRLSLNQAPAAPEQVHQSLLAGLCSHVGWYDANRRDYLGARGARFTIQPGSTLVRRPPEWVMAAELVETSRLWARMCAPIDPAWAEKAGAHLVRRSYSEPRWSAGRAAAVATERVTLYGVPLAHDRTVAYGSLDPAESRRLFIRHALVEGDWRTRHRFFHDNRRLLEQVQDLERRSRRRDIVVDDQALVDFYDQRIPPHVVSGAHFDSWWKKAGRTHPELLTFSEDLLVSQDATPVDEGDYPNEWVQGERRLPLTYQFEPGAAADGVTVHIPVAVLNQIDDTGFDWLVPGVRLELITALLRSLPKATRRRFVPVPEYAFRALAEIDPTSESLLTELSRALYVSTGTRVEPGEWDWSRVPDHLRMTFRVEDERGGRLAEGKDLTGLRERLRPAVREQMQTAAAGITETGLTGWTFGELPEAFCSGSGERAVRGFPALVDHGRSAAVEVLPTSAEAESATRLGVRRLVLLNTAVPWSRILAAIPNADKLALANNPHGSVPTLLDDCLAAGVDSIIADRFPIRTQADFQDALDEVRRSIGPRVLELIDVVTQVLALAGQVRQALDTMRGPASAPLRADLRAHLESLIYSDFVADTGHSQLGQLPRYLRGMLLRIERAPGALQRDAALSAQVAQVRAEYESVLAGLPAQQRRTPQVRTVRWLLEELRISLFAQTLGTTQPVSVKRIRTALDTLR